MKDLANEYGIFFPYLFLIIIILLFSRITAIGILKKNPGDLKYPNWITSGIKRSNLKNGIVNIIIAIFAFLVSWYFNFSSFLYIGWIAIGIGSAFLSFGIIHDFFPTSRKVIKHTKGKLSIYDTSIFVLIAFYFFIEYFQFIWPTYKEDQIEGRIRVLFYLSGMAFWSILVPLVILTIGRHRISIMSVIVLFVFSIFQAYMFLNYLFTDGKMIIEGYVFTLMISFSITIFILENLNYFSSNNSNS